MMFIAEYSLPIAAALLLVIFFLALPDLKRCKLPQFGLERREKDGLRASLPILVITVVYAFVAFFDLGNRVSPETFTDMRGRTVTIELTEPQPIERFMLFPGVGIGDYDIVYHDISGGSVTESFHQGHTEVLCWQSLEPAADFSAASVDIVGVSGNPWLGEAVFLDSDGNLISVGCSNGAVCDEQEKLVLSSSFMNSTYFDEIYHARTAWEHLNDVWPYEISHPPLGKIILSIGIQLFGMTPFGWRFMGTLCGVLMLPVMYAFLRRLFGGIWVPALGSMVFATDFMHFSQTRIATIDSYAVFFILLMYYFMYRYLTEDNKLCLALCGISFGLGAASKWTCLYAGAGLAVLWAMHWAYRLFKEKYSVSELLKNVGFCLVFFVFLPGLIYYLSYIPYGSAEGCLPFSSRYTQIVLDNQEFMFTYHAGVNAEHPYSSRWYQWLLNIRPILYYLEYFDDGSRSSIAAFLNPALCWGGFLFLFVLLYTAIGRKNMNAAFILIGYLAQVLPWVFISRVTFEYHYFAGSVFLVLAVAYVFDILRQNRKNWLCYAVPFTFVSLLLFVLFYPALSGAPINNELGTALMGWLPSWPL